MREEMLYQQGYLFNYFELRIKILSSMANLKKMLGKVITF